MRAAHPMNFDPVVAVVVADFDSASGPGSVAGFAFGFAVAVVAAALVFSSALRSCS